MNALATLAMIFSTASRLCISKQGVAILVTMLNLVLSLRNHPDEEFGELGKQASNFFFANQTLSLYDSEAARCRNFLITRWTNADQSEKDSILQLVEVLEIEQRIVLVPYV